MIITKFYQQILIGYMIILLFVVFLIAVAVFPSIRSLQQKEIQRSLLLAKNSLQIQNIQSSDSQKYIRELADTFKGNISVYDINNKLISSYPKIEKIPASIHKIRSALKKTDLYIVGSFSQSFYFTYVGDQSEILCVIVSKKQLSNELSTIRQRIFLMLVVLFLLALALLPYSSQ